MIKVSMAHALVCLTCQHCSPIESKNSDLRFNTKTQEPLFNELRTKQQLGYVSEFVLFCKHFGFILI